MAVHARGQKRADNKPGQLECGSAPPDPGRESGNSTGNVL